MERRMSFSQPGMNSHFFMNKNTPPVHTHTGLTYVCRYRKVPSDRCEGGFTPQLAVQTVVRPCGVKPSPGPPARSSFPITHFDTPVSRCVALISAHFSLIMFSFES